MTSSPPSPPSPAPSAPPAPPFRAADRAVAPVLALSMLLGSLGTSIANIALPRLADAFAAPFPQVQGVVVAYLAGLTAFVYVAGRLGDRLGLKPMLLAGLAVFALGALACGLASGLTMLIAARALQGVGAACLMTLSMALMRETADETRVGRAMGLLGTMSALGTAAGPSIGGLLLASTGWRGVFLAQVPLALAALPLAWACLPGGACRRRAPSVPWRTLRDDGLPAALCLNLLVAAVMMTTLVVGPFFLGVGLGLDEARVGLVMSVGPAISILGGVPSGRLVDAWGSRRVRAAGLGMLTCGVFLLAGLPGWIGVPGHLLAIAVLTPGYQLFQAANHTAVLADVPQERRGAVSGLLGLSRNIGLIAGTAVLGTAFAFGAGTPDIGHATPPALAAGMRTSFALAGALMLAALGIALRDAPGREDVDARR